MDARRDPASLVCDVELIVPPFVSVQVELIHRGHAFRRRGMEPGWERLEEGAYGDRKSTRLNSSHLVISYAVFCLKKKKKKRCHIICDISRQATCPWSQRS